MDRRFVDYTIRQSWNNALSVTFAHLFATALATSVSTASTQLLWWYLRKKSPSVSKIDALFALNSSSSNLYRLGVLKSIPVLWFFGLLIPLISVATIFPPGSLVIGQLPDFENSTDWVYTLDIDNRGSGNASDFFSHATFEINTNGEYLWPDAVYTNIAKRTVRTARYDPAPSPYGANSYYESGSLLKFDMSYWALGSDYSLRNISCIAHSATYKATVKWTNYTQSVRINVTEGQPLNVSKSSQDSLFYDVMKSVPKPTEIVYNDSEVRNNFTMSTLFDIYHETQLRSMAEALLGPLAGAISGFGTDNYFTMNTIIEDTPWKDTTYDYEDAVYSGVTFRLPAARIEAMMKNVSVSFMNCEEDENPPRLIGAYAGALGVSLLFILIGILALYQNDSPASSGGFLQIMCTTTYGDGIMNQLAKAASAGNDKGAAKNLADLKVRLGTVSGRSPEERYVAFGTTEETETLSKGL
ncbi:hypothetical protein SLS59_004794 [Nothophoma quercina]|uniref:Uncharacterized protein n=1 Tax=Nothophoma quercina TaxID=749835 RepID=A0ABR3RCB5_9PLEO